MKNRTVLVVNVIDLCVEISKYLSEKKTNGEVSIEIQVGAHTCGY